MKLKSRPFTAPAPATNQRARGSPITVLSVFCVARPIARSFWELQFERISGPGGIFAGYSVPAPSNVELQVPESSEKAVVKLPVELAQDDSWRMESGNGSGFWRHCVKELGWVVVGGPVNRPHEMETVPGQESSDPKDLVPLGPHLQWQAEGTVVGAEYYLLSLNHGL